MYVFHWLRLELRCPQRRRQRAAADFVYTMQIHIQLHIVLLVCVGAGGSGRLDSETSDERNSCKPNERAAGEPVKLLQVLSSERQRAVR